MFFSCDKFVLKMYTACFLPTLNVPHASKNSSLSCVRVINLRLAVEKCILMAMGPVPSVKVAVAQHTKIKGQEEEENVLSCEFVGGKVKS